MRILWMFDGFTDRVGERRDENFVMLDGFRDGKRRDEGGVI